MEGLEDTPVRKCWKNVIVFPKIEHISSTKLDLTQMAQSLGLGSDETL